MSSPGPRSARENLEKAIAAQESLRGTVEDSIIDATITMLKEKLAELDPVLQQQRKLATILFMDITGSTALTVDLDPEEQMAIVDPAISRLAKKIDEYGGRVARYQGDGFKAVFGLPVAHENDPEQAIRAGLAIQAEADAVALELESEHGLSGFKVRVGITTGLVFSGGETEGEDTIFGAAVNLAARLESAAEPGTILISHDSFKHVRGIFDFEPLEAIQVKGFAEPVKMYRVLQAKKRPFYRGMRGVEGVETHMVGRELEFLQLQKILEEVIEEGEGQMVTVMGEAGLGKSRLLYEFENWVDLLSEEVLMYKGRARLETQGLPYGLLRDLFAFQFGIQDDDRAKVVREKLDKGFGEGFGEGEASEKKAHVVGQLLGYGFHDSPHLAAILENPQQLRDQALLYLGSYFKSLSEKRPVLVLLEDLHWADEASLDALNGLASELNNQPVFTLATARHSLLERRPHWGEGQDFHRRILLEPLSKRESRQLVAEVLQKVQDVPEALSELLISNAEGNPFYVEELVKMLVEDEVIIREDPHWRVETGRLEEVYVPSTLTGVLQARLDGLPPEERKALQGASVVGRVFWDQVLEHINGSTDKGITDRGIADVLDDLRSRELIFRRETSAFAEAREHIFKHALLREVTYESVLKRVRQAYHALVAEWLIEHTGDRKEEFTGLIADHLEQAGKETEAYHYLVKAGKEAAAKYANGEAIHSFKRALELLMMQPDTLERARRELALQMGLGPPLIATRGFGAPVVERTYTRARELARQTGQSDLLFHATWGQWVHYNQIGETNTAKKLMAQLFHLAEQSGDEGLLLESHHSGWTTEWVIGNAIAAGKHIKKAVEIYRPEAHHAHIHLYGHDPKACGLSLDAVNIWFLGYQDQAHQRALEGVAFGETIEHPFSRAFSRWGLLFVNHLRGERGEEAAEYAREFHAFVKEQGFPLFISIALLIQGATLVKEGEGAQGLAKIRKAQSMVKSISALVFWPEVLSEFLEACLITGNVEEGLQAVDREKEIHSLTGQRWLESEIRRLYGELMLADDPDRASEAEAEFHLAIEISRRQHAKSMELRAAMSLARLWQKQGKFEQAHEYLSEIYNWFTEGFDTMDMIEAKALLEELEG
jgi:class 3 adenylate cyclase/predicted ATPase